MACSRKQRRAICFCAQLEQEGGSGRRDEDAREMRIADCLKEHDEGVNGRKKRAKKRELAVSLPPVSVSVSAGTTCDSYSPRTLLSRLLVSLQRPSPLRGGYGGEGTGCRVGFPRYGFSKREREKIEGEQADEATAAVEEEEVVVHRRSPANVVVALDSDAAEGVVSVRRKNNGELALSSEKSPNGEQSLNLGMGVGMVLLLSRSASELNKMTELREQMEMLLRDIKKEVQKKDAPQSYAESNKTVSSASERHGNVHSSSSNKLRRRASRDREVLQKSMEYSTSSTPTRSDRCPKRNQMEAELEMELERLQITVAGKSSLVPPNRARMQSEPVQNKCYGGYDKDLEEEDEVTEEMNGVHCGVSARELERKLNQLLKTRQLERIAELEASFNCDADPSDSFSEGAGELTEASEESSSAQIGVPAKLHALLETKRQARITELESALEAAQRRLLEKEREICWWRDTARLVSQRRDEALYR